ncbi:carbohydrate porin [Vibrio sp. SCSIO 43135]|uniref:carbohydrate porin n=1 Tax=Vibrio sp. SCSIO 43135 TaxID=2819096 RepID=UPI002074E611|nr:carbohydrate porin [Vibrio sp. SCSIO 43135]USD43929.1 carbohydrate porin [Vibrio sp. SCSIO 43135]
MKFTAAIASVCCLLLTPSVFAEANFGSPDSVDNAIRENERKKKSWREHLAAKHHLTFGFDYQALALSASAPTSGGDNVASSGVARFYGSWELVGLNGANRGGLVWKVEHRHSYTELAPKDLAFIGNGLGYAGMIAPVYSNQGSRLTNLYWKQKISDGRGTIMVGYLDTTDYVDVYALASPWTGFTNLAFSTGAGAVGLPDDGILGVAAGHMLNQNFYVVAGVADGKGNSDKPLDGFETLFNDHKLFTTFELGWTASQDQIYTDNIHITAWHLDGGTQHNLTSEESGRGINFSASYFATPHLMPFVRGGISEGDVALYDRSLTLGFGYFGLAGEKNNLGFAVNWSNVNDNIESAYAVGESKQFTAELYYNIELNDLVQLTPDLQYISDPAFSSEDSTWVVGLRARIII